LIAGPRLGGLCQQPVDVVVPACDDFMVIEQQGLALRILVSATFGEAAARSLHLQRCVVPPHLSLRI
jgi:hypothetical protein